MTDSTCKVCDGEGWVCEEHRSHAMNLCPSTLVVAVPCACNAAQDPPSDFEVIDVDRVQEEVDTLAVSIKRSSR